MATEWGIGLEMVIFGKHYYTNDHSIQFHPISGILVNMRITLIYFRYFLEFLDFVASIFSIYIYIYIWDMLYVYTHNKYNYLFQKTKEKIDFQKIYKIN